MDQKTNGLTNMCQVLGIVEPMGLDARDGAPTWVQPIKNRRGFEVILDRLEAALLSGELSVGDRLPGERELAAGFGVSRTSVREALRVLEALGILEVKRGTEGVSLRNEPGDAFADLLRLHIALGHYDARSSLNSAPSSKPGPQPSGRRRRRASLQPTERDRGSHGGQLP